MVFNKQVFGLMALRPMERLPMIKMWTNQFARWTMIILIADSVSALPNSVSQDVHRSKPRLPHGLGKAALTGCFDCEVKHDGSEDYAWMLGRG